jgi:hypothetical protein
MGPRRDLPYQGESQVDENVTPMQFDQADHQIGVNQAVGEPQAIPGEKQTLVLQAADDTMTDQQKEPVEGHLVGQATMDNRNVEEARLKSVAPLSLGGQDFAASGGIDLEPPAATDVAFHSQMEVDKPHIPKVNTLSPYHGGAITLYNHINLAFLSALDLSVDLVLPPYLSLSTVVNIIKLIRDDDCLIQDASKEVLLECLENLEPGEPQQVITELPPTDAVQKIKEAPGKRRAKKIVDPVDVKSLRRSTRLNKDLDGFKATGAGVAEDNALAYVGHFDRDAAAAPPPHLSKANVQAIGTGFLKIQPMALSDATLFASSDENNE